LTQPGAVRWSVEKESKMNMPFTTAIRGNFFDIAACVDHPQQLGQQLRHIPDGLMLLHEGAIAWFGSWQQANRCCRRGLRSLIIRTN
jgi:hypothetical protein